MHSNVIITRELIDNEYSQNVRNDIINKHNELEKLKHDLTILNGLELARAAEKYNELEKDIKELRRSLYIHGYKDDQSMNITNYILRVPNNLIEETNIAQVLSIKTHKELIRFSPLKQYFWYPKTIDTSKILKTDMEVNDSSYEDITQDNDTFTIPEEIIELFERGFGEINNMFILKQSEIFGIQVYKVNVIKGNVLSMKRLYAYKITSKLLDNNLITRFI